MDTILLLDTSGSMMGNPLSELKRAVSVFINNASQIGLDERIAIIEFGGNTRTLCHLTNNYNRVLSAANSMVATGSTPMADGLILALNEIKNNAVIHCIEDIILMPRIILMTDGQPDKRDEVLAVTRLCAEIGLPIACVGVSGCDAHLLRQVASISGGMFVMASDITKLSLFFLHQILMTLFIVKMIKQIENLLNRELLRQFIYEQTGERIDDSTLDAMVSMLANLTKRKNSSPSYLPSSSSNRRASPSTGLLAYHEKEREYSLFCFTCITFLCGFCFPYCWCCGALAFLQCKEKSATFMGLLNAILFLIFTISYFILWYNMGDIIVGIVVYFALICLIFGTLCCFSCKK